MNNNTFDRHEDDDSRMSYQDSMVLPKPLNIRVDRLEEVTKSVRQEKPHKSRKHKVHREKGNRQKEIPQENVVTIPQWNDDQFKMGTFNYIVGRRQTGKTVLFRSLYRKIIDQIDEFFAFTLVKEEYTDLTHEKHIFDDYDQLESLVSYFFRHPKTRRLVVIHNFDNRLMRMHSFQNLCMNSRHMNVTLVFISDYPITLPPQIRNNVDIVFLCPESSKPFQQKLYSLFGGMIDSYHEFREIFVEATKDYHCFVIDVAKDHSYGQFKAEIVKKEDLPKKTKEVKFHKSDKSRVTLEKTDFEQLKVLLRQVKSLCSKILDDLE